MNGQKRNKIILVAISILLLMLLAGCATQSDKVERSCAEARELMEDGHFADAVSLLQTALDENPKADNVAEAEALLQEAVNAAAKEAHLSAQKLYDSEEYKLAIGSLKELLAAYPQYDQVDEVRKLLSAAYTANKQALLIEEREKNCSLAEGLACQFLEEWTLWGASETRNAICVAYLVNADIYLVHLEGKMYSILYGEETWQGNLLAIMLHPDQPGWGKWVGARSTRNDRTRTDQIAQMAEEIAEMATENSLFDASNFPEDLSFIYSKDGQFLMDNR